MSEKFPYEVENFLSVDDERFVAPRDEPRFGGSGPTDRNAEVIQDGN